MVRLPTCKCPCRLLHSLWLVRNDMRVLYWTTHVKVVFDETITCQISLSAKWQLWFHYIKIRVSDRCRFADTRSSVFGCIWGISDTGIGTTLIKCQMKPRLSSNSRWICRSLEIPRESLIAFASEPQDSSTFLRLPCGLPLPNSIKTFPGHRVQQPVPSVLNSWFLPALLIRLSSRQRPRWKAGSWSQNKHKHNAWLDTKTGRGCRGH